MYAAFRGFDFAKKLLDTDLKSKNQVQYFSHENDINSQTGRIDFSRYFLSPNPSSSLNLSLSLNSTRTLSPAG